MGCVRWALTLGLVAAGCEVREAQAVGAREALPLQAFARGGTAVAEAWVAQAAGAAAGRVGGGDGVSLLREGPQPTGPLQVELLEDELARVVPLAGGPARTVARASLTAGVHEGDVVVDGRRDAGRTAELWRELAALRRRLARPAGGIDPWFADAR